MSRLRLEFGDPGAGWLPVRIELDDRAWEGAASFIPPPERPTLDGLCDSLCDVARGQPTRAAEFHLEPTVLELRFVELESHADELRLDLFERSDHSSRAPSEFLFGAVLSRETVVQTIWGALRRLEASIDAEEFAKYFAPFPTEALARLTALVRHRRSRSRSR